MLKYGPPGDVSQAVTILPRLEYSTRLLSEIMPELETRRESIRAANVKLLRGCSQDDPAVPVAIDAERRVAFSLEILCQVRSRLDSISDLSSIPKILPMVIPAVRTASAQLYDVASPCSRCLCELSVHLGSILLDSAILVTAKFDFGRSNSESAFFLDKVKLMTDSKINKQYCNLGLF